jgi:hypothetical protein
LFHFYGFDNIIGFSCSYFPLVQRRASFVNGDSNFDKDSNRTWVWNDGNCFSYKRRV